MACCRNDLGTFPHNKPIDTGILATSTGLHELSFKATNGSRFPRYITFTEGESIIIPAGVLNEDFVYDFEIAGPDQELYSQDGCSTYSLKTYINKVSCDDIQYL